MKKPIKKNKEKKPNKELKEIIEKIVPVLKRHGVKRAGIFGSFARGEGTKDSDIDVLVEVREDYSLFDISRLEMELEKILDRKVELLTYKSVHPLLKDKIFREEIEII